MRQSWSVNNLTDFVVDSVQTAPADEAPFYHLRFDRVFPDDFYVEMLKRCQCRRITVRCLAKQMGSSRPDGKPTRAKIDLFPNIFVICLKRSARCGMAGRVLAQGSRSAFVQRLAPGLKRRFGKIFQKLNLPLPILTRDIRIPYLQTYGQPWKGITVRSICRPIIRHRMSALSFTRCRPTAESRKAQMPFSLTVVMHSRLPITPGIQPTRLGRR